MKKRRELREAIAKSANGIKSNIYLSMVLEVSEIFRKALDGKEYAELTELQKEKRYAIMDILSMETVGDVSCIAALTAGMRGIDIRRCG